MCVCAYSSVFVCVFVCVCVCVCVCAWERDVEVKRARAVGGEILNGEATPEDSLWSDATGLASLE